MQQIPRWMPVLRVLIIVCLFALVAACRFGTDVSTLGGQEPFSAVTSVVAENGTTFDATEALTATVAAPVGLTLEPDPRTETTETAPSGERGVAIDQMLSSGVAGRPFRGAVLVARDGQMLLSRGYGLSNSEQNTPIRPETQFRIGSITKPFTALAVLLLQDRGRLDVLDAVCNYLPECPAAWADITLHHLLTHTSGIPDLTRAPDFAQFATQPATPQAVMARFSELPLDFAPGNRWQYSNSNYIVLGVVIEQVTQQSYAEFMQTQIFEPLQMANSGYDHNLDTVAVGYKPNGEPADFIDMSVPFAAGALYSSVTDLYVWDQALRTNGANSDHSGQILSPAALEAMFTPHAPMPEGGPDLSYGYGWILGQDAHGSYAEHVGTINGFSGKIRRYLETDAVIIVLSNEEGTNPNPIVERIAALMFDS